MKQPMNEEYNPICGGIPATFEYAIACGITVKPTVIPATKSDTPEVVLYSGNQAQIGRRFRRFFLVKQFEVFSIIHFLTVGLNSSFLVVPLTYLSDGIYNTVLANGKKRQYQN